MAYLLKDRHRGPVPSSKLALHAFPVKDKNSIIVPTVTGGCAADPSCDQYNIFPAGPAANVVRGAVSNLAVVGNRCISGDTIGDWYEYGPSALTKTALDYVYGDRSLKTVAADAGGFSGSRLDLTAITAAAQIYTAVVFAKAEAGKSVKAVLYDNAGNTNVTFTADGTWQLKAA
jgi:hypothetical protein